MARRRGRRDCAADRGGCRSAGLGRRAASLAQSRGRRPSRFAQISRPSPGFASLLFTYLLVLGLVVACAAARKIDLRTFIPSFTAIFWASVGCLLLGHFAYIAQTPDKRAGMGIGWSLGLTGEAGYLVALLAGLFVGNVLPALAARLKPAARPEWFIKTAIVLLARASESRPPQPPASSRRSCSAASPRSSRRT